MAHILVERYASRHRIQAILRVVMITAMSVRGVDDATIKACKGGLRVMCSISPWWWLALGARHMVVRKRVQRELEDMFKRWPNPGVVSVWVL